MTEDRMTDREIVKLFAENFEEGADGFTTPHDVASGFFNSNAEIDNDGGICLVSQGTWVGSEGINRFSCWLIDNGYY
ncbi:MAG: hypothetical protein GY700_01640 [Propionibacteriaceae bacterium]|nr:hypothetical protein [Propionibacteriaceae bacterium]